MAKVADRTLADGYVEDVEVFVLEVRCADDRVVGVDVRFDLSDLLAAVAKCLECERNGAIDDSHRAATDKLLELDE